MELHEFEREIVKILHDENERKNDEIERDAQSRIKGKDVNDENLGRRWLNRHEQDDELELKW